MDPCRPIYCSFAVSTIALLPSTKARFGMGGGGKSPSNAAKWPAHVTLFHGAEMGSSLSFDHARAFPLLYDLLSQREPTNVIGTGGVPRGANGPKALRRYLARRPPGRACGCTRHRTERDGTAQSILGYHQQLDAQSEVGRPRPCASTLSPLWPTSKLLHSLVPKLL